VLASLRRIDAEDSDGTVSVYKSGYVLPRHSRKACLGWPITHYNSMND
jgi:hypothetical protein